jgi:hypothetical protein
MLCIGHAHHVCMPVITAAPRATPGVEHLSCAPPTLPAWQPLRSFDPTRRRPRLTPSGEKYLPDPDLSFLQKGTFLFLHLNPRSLALSVFWKTPCRFPPQPAVQSTPCQRPGPARQPLRLALPSVRKDPDPFWFSENYRKCINLAKIISLNL